MIPDKIVHQICELGLGEDASLNEPVSLELLELGCKSFCGNGLVIEVVSIHKVSASTEPK